MSHVIDATPGADAREPADAGATLDAIVVRLGAGRFAVDLGNVAEVGRMPSLTRVPGLPAWVAGVANWRGRILAVLDLRSLLGASTSAASERARMLILTDSTTVAGLLVDAVDGTMTLSEISQFPASLTPAVSGLVSGQAPLLDGPIAVLDVPGIVALRDSLPRGRRSA